MSFVACMDFQYYCTLFSVLLHIISEATQLPENELMNLKDRAVDPSTFELKSMTDTSGWHKQINQQLRNTVSIMTTGLNYKTQSFFRLKRATWNASMVLGSTQPLTEMSTRNISWG
jgi:hypothetical protein